MTATLMLVPGQTSLSTWRTLYRGAGVQLAPSTHGAIRRSAQTVDAIIARGAHAHVDVAFGD